MASLKSFVMFVVGTAAGAAAGVGLARALAPQSGEELQTRVQGYTDKVRTAGDAAQESTERELATKYRFSVEDQAALRSPAAAETIDRLEAAQAIGLGLNVPGAIAAHRAEPIPPESEPPRTS